MKKILNNLNINFKVHVNNLIGNIFEVLLQNKYYK